MIFEAEAAAERINRMWLKLAKHLERAALQYIKDGSQASALTAAKAAEVCFWRATGNEDCLSLKDSAHYPQVAICV